MNSSRSFLLALLLLIACAVPASALTIEELTPYFGGQYFSWEEQDEGRRLLREAGPLFSGGVLLGATASPWTLRGKAEVFGGSVGYDGETQAPASEPVETDVGYFGTRQEFDLGCRLLSSRLQIEPFVGVGFRWWLRLLQDSTSAGGHDVSGYTEWWKVGYGRFGARGSYPLPSGASVFAEGGARYPFYAANSIDFANDGWTTFHPVGNWSGFGEAGMTWGRLRLALFYEGLRFSRSPRELVQNQYFVQPDSSSDVVGLSLGWNLR